MTSCLASSLSTSSIWITCRRQPAPPLLCWLYALLDDAMRTRLLDDASLVDQIICVFGVNIVTNMGESQRAGVSKSDHVCQYAYKYGGVPESRREQVDWVSNAVLLAGAGCCPIALWCLSSCVCPSNTSHTKHAARGACRHPHAGGEPIGDLRHNGWNGWSTHIVNLGRHHKFLTPSRSSTGFNGVADP